MIFTGDIAVPGEIYSKQLDQMFERHAGVFKDKEILCNLEGVLANVDTQQRTPVLFNHPSVVPVLKKWNFKVAGLANNHTLDLPAYFKTTKDSLAAAEIAAPGAGYSAEEAAAPVQVVLDGKQAFVYNFCWHVMLQHQDNPSSGIYVGTIQWKAMLEAVAACKAKHPNALILMLMHWSFDLETLPFPIYRQFSRALIDAGANIIAGCHAHCVQGAEAYKDGYIVYGMGNFFVPWHTFIQGKIHFPEFARKEMAFEWDPHTNRAKCHWFTYTNENDIHSLSHIASEDFEQGKINAFYSPYAGMTEKEYQKFFKTNRRKKGGIPIYRHHREVWRNKAVDWLIIRRIRLARALAKYKVREWNN